MSFLEVMLYVLFGCAVLLVGYCSYVYAQLRGTDRKANGQTDTFFLWAIVGGVFGGSTLLGGLDLGWNPFLVVLIIGIACFAVGTFVKMKRVS